MSCLGSTCRPAAALLLLALAAIPVPFTAFAQTAASEHAGGQDANLPQPESKADALASGPQFTIQDSEEVKQRKFSTPDVPRHWESWSSYKSEYFSLRFGFAGLLDYTAFGQNDDSVAQVGKQRDQWDTRSARFSLAGGAGPRSFKLRYLVSFEYKGLDAPDNEDWAFTDLNITMPAGKLGALTFGKTKEPFVYEMVGDAAFLPQLERVLNPFFTSRNVGIVLGNSILKKRMTYRAGWFNDWWLQDRAFDRSGNHFAGRLTGLASINEEGTRYLHLGGSLRYAGANNAAIRLRGRPESNVASYFVDTGDIPAANRKDLALEALWNRDGYSFTAEYATSFVNASQSDNPSFNGLSLVGSWVITGENRPYDRNVGYARRVIPRRHLGAVELVARYSRLDLDSGAIRGGTMNKGHLGLNWFLNSRWKLGFGGGFAHLDRSARSGFTNFFQARLQLIY